HRPSLYGLHLPVGGPVLARPRRHVEGKGAGDTGMTELSSGKGHNDENFPVASFLIAPRHRPPVMAFYNFVRAADDVADHETASADKKLSMLEDFRKSLTGES